MSGRALHAELAAVRALVADARAGITETEDTGHIWIRTACARLAAFDGLLTEAAGVPAEPVRVAAATVTTFLIVAGPAALATAAGLGTAGVLAVAALALVAGSAAMPWARRRVFALVGRRRLAAASRPPVSSPGLTRVPEELLRARVRLVSAAMRHVGPGGWTAPRLRRAIRTDPVARRLAHADQMLCQAIDCVERCLGDPRKDVP